jgi:hypothetical protein
MPLVLAPYIFCVLFPCLDDAIDGILYTLYIALRICACGAGRAGSSPRLTAR